MLNKTILIHSKPTKKVGFVLKPHGFNGHLRIKIEEDYIPDSFLLLEINEKFVPFAIQSYHAQSSILKLREIDSLDAAERLSNLSIVCLSEEKESEDFNLQGFTIYDEVTQQRYEVTNVIRYPGNELIEFRVDYKDVLLPWHPDFVLQIDEINKTIRARFPEGLLDL